jgi:cellulose synthase/poly-beta-1,6-N-acetylglucosamine synthase-like glycosyltransferase
MSSLSESPEVDRLTVTIGLTTLNEEKTVGRALDALMRGADAIGAEIVVVAGGSDRTVEIVNAKLQSRSRDKVLIDSVPQGKPSALNRLVSAGSGEILVLTDGDVEVGDGSIELLLRALEDEGVGCACGRVTGSSSDGNAIQKACGLMAEMMHKERSERYASEGSVDLASGNLMAVRRSLFPILPLDSNSDDGYISLAVRSKGKKIAYVKDAVAVVKFPSTFSDFLRQKVRTRYGHLQLRLEFPDTTRRDALGEVRSFFRTRRNHDRTSCGIEISILATCLAGCAWGCAYLRYCMPWLFRKPVWVPVRTTK